LAEPQSGNVNCNLQVPAELTVGTQFLLHCQTDSTLASQLQDVVKVQFAGTGIETFTLVPLRWSASASGFDVQVTSYAVGEHQVPAVDLVLTQKEGASPGSLRLTSGPLAWTVKSVLDPKEPRTEPFGAQGALKLSLPWWYWAVGAVVLLGLVLGLWRRLRQNQFWRQELRELDEKYGRQDPAAQAFAELRALRRLVEAQEPVDAPLVLLRLQECVRIYLARRWRVPPSCQNRAKFIDRALSERHPSAIQDLEKLRRELQRLDSLSAAEQSAVDLMQLLSTLRRWLDQVESSTTGSKRDSSLGRRSP